MVVLVLGYALVLGTSSISQVIKKLFSIQHKYYVIIAFRGSVALVGQSHQSLFMHIKA